MLFRSKQIFRVLQLRSFCNCSCKCKQIQQPTLNKHTTFDQSSKPYKPDEKATQVEEENKSSHLATAAKIVGILMVLACAK